MVFDNFILGSKLDSNINNNKDSYIDDINNKLYVIPSLQSDNGNIRIYDITNCNLKDDSNIPVHCNIPLYNSFDTNECFIINDDNINNNILELYSKDLTRYLTINKTDCSFSNLYVNENISNISNDNSFNCNEAFKSYVDVNTDRYLIPYNYNKLIKITDDIECNIDILNDFSNYGLFKTAQHYTNHIYLIPYNYANIIKYNVATQHYTEISLNEDLNRKLYSDSITIGNKIYCIPYNADKILIIDPTNDTLTSNADGPLLFEQKYSKGINIQGDNTKIYLIPARQTNVHIYDINANTITKNYGNIYGNDKFSTGIFIDSNIYLIPDNHNYIARFDTTTCNITNLFELKQSNFSSAYKKDNDTIYMISNKLGFIGVLKNPYTIDSYYTIDLDVVNQHYCDINFTTDKLLLIPENNNIYTRSITFINSSTSRTNTDNYISGFYYDNYKFLIHVSGKYIIKISNDNIITKIIDFIPSQNLDSIPDKNNNVITILVKGRSATDDDYLYIIISDSNLIIKWKISSSTIQGTIITIDNFYKVTRKFSKAIYSRITNKIYLIPYNISEMVAINIENNDTIEFIDLKNRNKKLLIDLRYNAFFVSAIENQGYIYMIPEAYNFIFVFSVYTNKLHNIIDISSFNNKLYELYKFVNAHLYEDESHKKIFMISNRREHLGIIDFDIGENAILDSEVNFNIISKNLFIPHSTTNIYGMETIEIGSKIEYSATVKYGNVLFTLKSSDDNTSNLFEFRPKTNIRLDIENKLVALYNFENNTSNALGLADLDLSVEPSSSEQYVNLDLQQHLNSNLKLDGNTTLNIDNISTINFTNQIAIAFWTSNITDDGTVFEYKENDTNNIKCYYSNVSNLHIEINNTDIYNIEINSLDHIVLNISNNDINIYNSNVATDLTYLTDLTNNFNNFNSFEIGNRYNGYLDNFCIFKETLTDDEIDALYRTGNYFNDIFRTTTITNSFKDTNGKTIFEIYKPSPNEIKYIEFDPNDFLVNNKIQKLSINNIYSIENNTVYFIPYNFKYLLALELDNTIPLLKIIDINKNTDPNKNELRTYITNDDIKGKFNTSIIVDNKLYLAPYIESGSATYYPIVVYNFVNDTDVENVNITEIQNINSSLDSESGGISSNLFCTILFYYKNIQYLFFIKEKARKSLLYKIDNSDIQQIGYTDNCLDHSNIEYSDGYITNDYIYLLDSYGSNIYKYEIQVNDSSFKFDCNNIITFDNDTDIPKYSKMLEHSNMLYLIPYNTNNIGIYDISSASIEYSCNIGNYSSNQELYKGGTIMELNNISYLIMVPYDADKLYMYNIDDKEFTYIEDPIFKTNKFTGCTVDLKGNIYMNTEYGDILYYSLSVAKFYKQPRLPVLLKNKDTISFKDLYEKFHTDYIYPEYNYNNKQIRFSDYFNNGGAKYYTVANTKDNEFIIDTTNTISNVNDQTNINTSYETFIEQQCNISLTLSHYSNIRSQRYEYYDTYIANIDYTIDSIKIKNDNTYLYYTQCVPGHLNGYVKLITKRTPIGKDEELLIISDLSINNTDPRIEEIYKINIGTIRIKEEVISDYYDFGEKTDILIYLNTNKFFDETNPSYVDLDSSNFIENGISDGIPNDTMSSITKITFNIKGTIENGIRINMDDVDGNYLTNLRNIDIKIFQYGIIHYNDDLEKLITFINPKHLPDILTLTIKENINEKLHCNYTDLNAQIRLNANRKISKLIIDLTETATIDLDDFINLIYLREIVIISFNNRNDITIINGDNLKQDINIIIYENFDNLIKLLYLFNNSLAPDSTTEYPLIHNNGDPTYDTENGEYPCIRLNGENQYLTLSTIDFDIKSFGLGFYLSDVSDDNYLLRFDEDFYIKVDANSLDIQINTETNDSISKQFENNTWYSIFFNYNDTNDMYDIYIDNDKQDTTIPYDPFIDKELIIGKYTDYNEVDVEIINMQSLHYASTDFISIVNVNIDDTDYIYSFITYEDLSYSLSYMYKIGIDNTKTAITLTPNDDDVDNEIPGYFKYYSMVSISSNIYIFGGEYHTGQAYYSSNIYKIDKDGNTQKITLIPNDNNVIPPKMNHSMVAINSNIYIFGGSRTYDEASTDDFYKIDTTTFVSTKIELQPIDGDYNNKPFARSKHSMTTIGSNIYIYGGENRYISGDGQFTDMYRINTEGKTEKIILKGKPQDIPSKRNEYFEITSMVALDDYIYLYNNTGDIYKIDTDGNSQLLPSIKHPYGYNLLRSIRTIESMVVIGNDIYTVTIWTSESSANNLDNAITMLSKITPTNRNYHLNGNIAELRINNVITSDSEIIDNYSNLDYYYNQSL